MRDGFQLGHQDSGPLPCPFCLNLVAAIQQSSNLTKGHNSAQSRLFYFIPVHPGKAQGLHPYLLEHQVLHHISCMRDSLLFSSCAAYNADWYARLGAQPTLCNVSCTIYLWTKHTYRLVPPKIIGGSHTFHRLSILYVSFFISNLLF